MDYQSKLNLIKLLLLIPFLWSCLCYVDSKQRGKEHKRLKCKMSAVITLQVSHLGRCGFANAQETPNTTTPVNFRKVPQNAQKKQAIGRHFVWNRLTWNSHFFRRHPHKLGLTSQCILAEDTSELATGAKMQRVPVVRCRAFRPSKLHLLQLRFGTTCAAIVLLLQDTGDLTCSAAVFHSDDTWCGSSGSIPVNPSWEGRSNCSNEISAAADCSGLEDSNMNLQLEVEVKKYRKIY